MTEVSEIKHRINLGEKMPDYVLKMSDESRRELNWIAEAPEASRKLLDGRVAELVSPLAVGEYVAVYVAGEDRTRGTTVWSGQLALCAICAVSSVAPSEPGAKFDLEVVEVVDLGSFVAHHAHGVSGMSGGDCLHIITVHADRGYYPFNAAGNFHLVPINSECIKRQEIDYEAIDSMTPECGGWRVFLRRGYFFDVGRSRWFADLADVAPSLAGVQRSDAGLEDDESDQLDAEALIDEKVRHIDVRHVRGGVRIQVELQAGYSFDGNERRMSFMNSKTMLEFLREARPSNECEGDCDE